MSAVVSELGIHQMDGDAPKGELIGPLLVAGEGSRCGRTGGCYDNAVAESFFATLKNEMYYRESFATRAQAKMAVIEFIETYYNRKRPHSTIGYRIPAQLMEDFFKRTTPMQSAMQKAA